MRKFLVPALLALFVVQPYYARGAFVHESAFAAYGSSPLGVVGGEVDDHPPAHGVAHEHRLAHAEHGRLPPP